MNNIIAFPPPQDVGKKAHSADDGGPRTTRITSKITQSLYEELTICREAIHQSQNTTIRLLIERALYLWNKDRLIYPEDYVPTSRIEPWEERGADV